MAARQTPVPSATDAADSSALAARYYTDPEIHSAELSEVFARSWHLVGHQTQVGTPGQVLTATVGDEQIFVVNDGGQIRAFFNVCQHRGHELFPPERPGGRVIRHTARGVLDERSRYTRPTDCNDYAAFYIWPASSLQCYPGQALNTYRWLPLGPDRTLLIRGWWFDGSEPTEEEQGIIDLDWNTTVTEDLGLVESAQRGVRSRGYRPGPLVCDPSGTPSVHSEDAVAHLGVLVRAALGDER